MALLQVPIQRKLSALLGARVTFEKLTVSLLGGSIDAVGMTVTGEEGAEPVLAAARVRAEVAVARALKGEIVVRSLTIERPVVSVVRGADGATNLPKRAPAARGEAAAPQAAEDEKTAWSFDVEKVLVIDGQVKVRLGDFVAGADRVLAELKRQDGGYGVTFLAEGVGRRDVSVDLGRLRGTATLSNVSDLAAIASAGVDAQVEVGKMGRIRYSAAALRSPDATISFEGTIRLPDLLALLPGGAAKR